jgi:hypothetical protein
MSHADIFYGFPHDLQIPVKFKDILEKVDKTDREERGKFGASDGTPWNSGAVHVGC